MAMADALVDKLKALRELLPSYGPYRREQLRLTLVSKANLLRDEALHAELPRERFAHLGPRPSSGSTSPMSLCAAAAELEHLAQVVAHWSPSAPSTRR
jgi:hypothetical protein